MKRSAPTPVKKILLNGKLCAAKLFNNPPASTELKEIAIHKVLSHQFIVKYLTHWYNPAATLVMEYLEYNVRSLVVPGRGMDPLVGHLIFAQLTEVVRYLHGRGVCHRDIKPDNILMDGTGNIRLCDFGHSTVFRGRNRLKTTAGTPEFMAPEVVGGDYDGEAADVFSMGVTLLNVMTGELPWETASDGDGRYTAFRRLRYHRYAPFTRLRPAVLKLVDGMLRDEKERIKLIDIVGDGWVSQETRLIGPDRMCRDSGFLSGFQVFAAHFTQPDAPTGRDCQIQNSQPVSFPAVHRFYAEGGYKEVTVAILKALERMGVLFQREGSGIQFSTTDSRRNKLTGEIVIQDINGSSVVTVKKGRGDTEEFKKFTMILSG